MESRLRVKTKPLIPSEWAEYYAACDELAKEFDKPSDLKQFAVKVSSEVKKLAGEEHSHVPITKLTEILNTTASILKGPVLGDTENEAYREDILTLQQQCGDIKSYPVAKGLIGAMLCLLGAAIVVASGIVGAVSFGLAAPISVMGIMLGLSTLVGGVCVASGVIGASFMMFGAPLVGSAVQASPLRKSMIELETNAKRVHRVSTCCVC